MALCVEKENCLYQKLRQEWQNHCEEQLERAARGIFTSPSSDKLVMGPDSWSSTMSSTLAPSNCWLASSSHYRLGWPAAAFDAVAKELVFPRGIGSQAGFTLSCLLSFPFRKRVGWFFFFLFVFLLYKNMQLLKIHLVDKVFCKQTVHGNHFVRWNAKQ